MGLNLIKNKRSSHRPYRDLPFKEWPFSYKVSKVLLFNGRYLLQWGKDFLSLIIFFLLMFGFNACKKETEMKANQPPETKISINEINLEGEDRLSTTVTLNWSGTDQDGFVKGFEFSFDQEKWHYTERTDSTFNFTVTSESQYEDIEFNIRAIDNDDLRDPDPAQLNIPIKNTPPTAQFQGNEMPEDTAFTVFPLSWKAADPDGEGNIDSVFVRVNSGPWQYFSPNIRFLTLVPGDPEGEGKMESKVYAGLQPELVAPQMEGLRLNAKNEFYLKVKDIAGATSEVDTAGPFYVTNQTSDLLVLGAGSGNPDPSDIYKPILRDVYDGFDFIDLYENNQGYLTQFWNSVFSLHIRLYDKLFIYSDGAEVDGELILESSASALQEYLNDQNKLLITSSFPRDLASTSPVFNFSPMDSFTSSEGQARIRKDSLLVPEENRWDTLQSSNIVVGATPFYPKNSADVMHTAQLQKLNNWEGPDEIIAATKTNGNINQVFSAVELHQMNGKPENLKSFFEQILANEFDW